MENERHISDGIDDFLTFLREIEQTRHIYLSIEWDADNETQDILHIIELKEVNQNELDSLYNKLKEIRCKRRKAKEYILQTASIINWIDENRNVVKGIERLLGEVRKAERHSQNKIFTPKTEIFDEIFEKRNEEKNEEDTIPLF